LYGKVEYDALQDAFRCEFPVRGRDGMRRVCGKWCKDLVRHITRHHGIPVKEYKRMLGIDMKESLMSEDTKRKLRVANRKHKTYQNLKLGEKHRFKKGENKVQSYKRSEQTKKRLRNIVKKSIK